MDEIKNNYNNEINEKNTLINELKTENERLNNELKEKNDELGKIKNSFEIKYFLNILYYFQSLYKV